MVVVVVMVEEEVELAAVLVAEVAALTMLTMPPIRISDVDWNDSVFSIMLSARVLGVRCPTENITSPTTPISKLEDGYIISSV